MLVKRPVVSPPCFKRHVWVDKEYQGPGPWDIPQGVIADTFVREYLKREYGDDFFASHTMQTGDPESSKQRHDAFPGVEQPY